jgi:hypothetical protein
MPASGECDHPPWGAGWGRMHPASAGARPPFLRRGNRLRVSPLFSGRASFEVGSFYLFGG